MYRRELGWGAVIRLIKTYYQQLLIVILAFATMVCVSFWYVKDVVQQQAETNGNAVIDTANATIQSLLAETEASLVNVVFSVEAMVANAEPVEVIASHMVRLTHWFFTKAQRNFAFNGIYGYINGTYIDGRNWVPPDAYNPVLLPWYVGAMRNNGAIYYTDPYVDAETRKVIISTSQQVFDARRRPCGVISMDFDISAASEYIKALNTAEGGYSFLLNDRLEVLAHRDTSLHGRSFAGITAGYAELAGALAYNDRVSAVEIIDHDGTESVVFVSKLFNDWYVGTVSPISLYYGKVKTMAVVLTLLGAALTCLLSFFLISLYVAKEEADERSMTKSSFLARMSHEIRTPLNAVMGMSELILRESNSIPPKICEHVLDIKHASVNLLAIINDILDLSKIELGRMEIVSAPYMLSSLVNDVINIIRTRVSEKKLCFTVFVESSLPNDLIGDEIRVRQILLNLLSNAVKYTEKGYVALSFRMAARSDESVEFLISVADSGKGIRAGDQKKLFDEFVRVDMDRNKNVEGTGLGLAITKSLVTQMGGEIGLSSVHGKGSTFTVALPQRYTGEEVFAKVANPEEKHSLLYGDTVLYSLSLASSMADLGVPHELAASQSEFIEKIRHHKYPFIFVEDASYEALKPVLEDSATDATVILFASSLKDAGMRVHRSIIMPGHSLSVANALNNVPDTAGYRSEAFSGMRFKAPTARVLVVDDILTNLRVVEGLLSPYGVQVDCCRGGLEAISLVQENSYDLVFMDHMMPEMDGNTATRRIRSLGEGRFKSVPIIALTANAVSGMKDVFLENGMNDFLPKPIDPGKLDLILQKWIPEDKREEAGPTAPVPEKASLPAISGVDLETAMRRFEGNCDLYLQILHAFSKHTPPLLHRLRACLRENNLGDYAVAVHGIKGSAANIGAKDVASLAARLEAAAKAGESRTVLYDTDSFILAVEGLIREFTALVKRHSVEEDNKEMLFSPDPEHLEAMLEACLRYDMLAMAEILEQLEGYTYKKHGDLVPWLREQVDTLEYDQIRKRLEATLAEMDELG